MIQNVHEFSLVVEIATTFTSNGMIPQKITSMIQFFPECSPEKIDHTPIMSFWSKSRPVWCTIYHLAVVKGVHKPLY